MANNFDVLWIIIHRSCSADSDLKPKVEVEDDYDFGLVVGMVSEYCRPISKIAMSSQDFCAA